MNHTQCVERAIEVLAGAQLGVITRVQAVEVGATRRMIEYRVKHDAWPRVLPGVHRISGAAGLERQSAMAASLWAAPEGLVSHTTAAKLWDLEGINAPGVHVTLPKSRHLRSAHVIVHRVVDLLPADVARRGPIAVTSALRTAIDLAGLVTPETLEVAIESALRRRLFTVGQLRWRAELLMGPGRRGSSELRALLAKRDLGRTDRGWEVKAAQLLERAASAHPPANTRSSTTARRLPERTLLTRTNGWSSNMTATSGTAEPSAVTGMRLGATGFDPSAGPSSRSPPTSCATPHRSSRQCVSSWRLRWVGR